MVMKDQIGCCWETIYERFPHNFFIKDRHGVVLDCNERDAKTCGFSSKQAAIGTDDFTCFSHEDAEALREMDQTVMATGESMIRGEWATINGQKRSFLSRKSPFRNASGNIIGIIGYSIEVKNLELLEPYLNEQADVEALIKAIELSRPIVSLLPSLEAEVGRICFKNPALTRQQFMDFAHEYFASKDLLGRKLLEGAKSYVQMPIEEYLGDFKKALAAQYEEENLKPLSYFGHAGMQSALEKFPYLTEEEYVNLVVVSYLYRDRLMSSMVAHSSEGSQMPAWFRKLDKDKVLQ